MKKPTGRPLKPRSDTERLDLLVKLLGYGQARVDVAFMWRGSNLVLCVPGGGNPNSIASTTDGEVRSLLDRALSPNAAKHEWRKKK